MNAYRKTFTATALAALVALAGCWDDDDDDVVGVPPNAEVPDSAGVSTASFVSYLLALGAADETSEPLILKDTLSVPPDESDGPTVLP